MALGKSKAKKKYAHLFFDLDHTLWDYDANARETLAELYHHYKFDEQQRFTVEQFIEKFFIINHQLWYAFNHGRSSKEEIRTTRFPAIFKLLGIKKADAPENIGDEYIEICPTKSNLMPDAMHILEYLFPNYDLHIITNGFNHVQNVKIKEAKLDPFFKQVITSESTGHAKPKKEIFEHALKVTGASAKNSLMIGDNLLTDIIGARDVLIDQIFYNPEAVNHTEKITFEIKQLKQIKDLL